MLRPPNITTGPETSCHRVLGPRRGHVSIPSVLCIICRAPGEHLIKEEEMRLGFRWLASIHQSPSSFSGERKTGVVIRDSYSERRY